jgi:GMP synthase PP-ATPase subunit
MLRHQIRKAGLYDKIWQAFAVLLPVKTRRRHGRRADV